MKLLRVQQVAELTGLSTSSIYKQIRLGNFPKSIPITKRATAWPEEVIFDWISEKSSPAIRVEEVNDEPPL